MEESKGDSTHLAAQWQAWKIKTPANFDENAKKKSEAIMK